MNMAKVVLKIKALPKDTSQNIEELTGKIKEFLAKYGEVYKTESQPLAFGLTVIMITLIVEEDAGTTKLEEGFSEFKDASLDIIELTRAADF